MNKNEEKLKNKISEIKLDDNFFKKEKIANSYLLTFQELQDFSLPVPEKIPCKPNPFLLGGCNSSIPIADSNTSDITQNNQNATNDNTDTTEVIEQPM